MKSSAIIELIGWAYKDARCPNESAYPNWVVFKLCVSKKYKDKNAKICKQYVKDRMGLLVKGIPKAKAFVDNSGNPQASIEVQITELNILTSPKEKATDKHKENGRYKIGESRKDQEPSNDIEDDEIPF